MLDTLMSDQPCQLPVGVTDWSPVTLLPSTSRRTFAVGVVPTAKPDATRKVTVYARAVVTLTEYISHSPVFVQPRLDPAPVSVVFSRSTPSVVRKVLPFALPRFAASLSW